MKYLQRHEQHPAAGRSPCGERGLKYYLEHNIVCVITSLPVRGAWIEIRDVEVKIRLLLVAPRAGSVD